MIMPINKDDRELEAINDALLEAINDALRSKHKDIKRLRGQKLISEKFGNYLTQLTLMRGVLKEQSFLLEEERGKPVGQHLLNQRLPIKV